MLVDLGRSDLLSVITGQLALDTYDIGLFTSSAAIVEGDTYASIVEASFGGYARVTTSGWLTPTGPVSGIWNSNASNVTFTNSSGSPATVYGFFFIGTSRGIFYGGDLFSSPIVIPAGGSVVITPSWFDTTA